MQLSVNLPLLSGLIRCLFRISLLHLVLLFDLNVKLSHMCDLPWTYLMYLLKNNVNERETKKWKKKRKQKERRRKTRKVWRGQESNFIDPIFCSRYAEHTNQLLFKNIFDAYWIHVPILFITCPVTGLSIDQCTSYVLSKSFCRNFVIDRSCSWTHCFFSAISIEEKLAHTVTGCLLLPRVNINVLILTLYYRRLSTCGQVYTCVCVPLRV